jgi:hypothetical protein
MKQLSEQKRMPSKHHACLGAILSNIVTWSVVGLLCGQSYAQDMAESPHPALTHDQILITLPVFVSSIIATAFFTWTIAQYDRKRDKRIDQTQQLLSDLTRRLGDLETKG